MEGRHVPCVVFKTRVRDERAGGEKPFRRRDTSSDELFAGQRVVAFSLRSEHVPLEEVCPGGSAHAKDPDGNLLNLVSR